MAIEFPLWIRENLNNDLIGSEIPRIRIHLINILSDASVLLQRCWTVHYDQRSHERKRC
jgi:hypothetical protein